MPDDASGANGSDDDPIAIKLDREFKTAVRVAAAQQNKSMSEWAREAFREKLAREGDDADT